MTAPGRGMLRNRLRAIRAHKHKNDNIHSRNPAQMLEEPSRPVWS